MLHCFVGKVRAVNYLFRIFTVFEFFPLNKIPVEIVPNLRMGFKEKCGKTGCIGSASLSGVETNVFLGDLKELFLLCQ